MAERWSVRRQRELQAALAQEQTKNHRLMSDIHTLFEYGDRLHTLDRVHPGYQEWVAAWNEMKTHYPQHWFTKEKTDDV